MNMNTYILNEVEKHVELEGHEAETILTNIGNLVHTDIFDKYTLKEVLDMQIEYYVTMRLENDYE